MKKIFLFILMMCLYVISLKAQTKKDGTPDMRYNSNKKSSTYSAPTPHSSENNGSRPVYNGQTHTTSHGGKYLGEQNSRTHKGGIYTNPKSNNNYGIHKTK